MFLWVYNKVLNWWYGKKTVKLEFELERADKIEEAKPNVYLSPSTIYAFVHPNYGRTELTELVEALIKTNYYRDVLNHFYGRKRLNFSEEIWPYSRQETCILNLERYSEGGLGCVGLKDRMLTPCHVINVSPGITNVELGRICEQTALRASLLDLDKMYPECLVKQDVYIQNCLNGVQFRCKVDGILYQPDEKSNLLPKAIIEIKCKTRRFVYDTVKYDNRELYQCILYSVLFKLPVILIYAYVDPNVYESLREVKVAHVFSMDECTQKWNLKLLPAIKQCYDEFRKHLLDPDSQESREYAKKLENLNPNK